MTDMLKKIFSVAALVSTVALYGSAANVVPYYSIRSQGIDAARELAGWTQHVNLFDMDKVYGTMSLTTEYAQSFRPQAITQSLFGAAAVCPTSCGSSVVNISGSQAANIGANDLLADNFYLPTNFQSTVSFSPVIQNVVVDLDFYFGFDEWCNGFFFRLNAPINWTRWNLNFCENVATVTGGYNDALPGYYNAFDVLPVGTTLPASEGIGIEASKLNQNFTSYAAGNAPTGVNNVIMNGLCFAKMNPCGQALTRLTDLTAILGWNFLNDEDYHLGVGLLVRAPTGNTPTAEYLFEPISGNGGHWEVGAQITSHATLWRCESEESSLGFYLDANITHMFNANQVRTFDLNCSPLSRYMLASQFGPASTNSVNTGSALAAGAVSGSATIPSRQFANVFSPVANLTTQQVKVSVGVQADLAAQFTYANGGFNWDIGYNFWGRSCDQFNCNTNNNCTVPCAPCVPNCNSVNVCPVTFAANSWGLKGDAYVYGFDNNGDTLVVPMAVPLSATESKATIYNGTNSPTTGALTPALVADAYVNPNVDNAQPAWHGVGGRLLSADPADLVGQTNTSLQPVLLTAANFNIAGTSGISNKIYTHLSYNWVECDDWVPYIGVGAFGEFGSGNCNNSCNTSCNTTCNTACNTACPTVCPTTTTTAAAALCNTNCNTNCNNCVSSALSQWGVWVKAGLSFN